MTYLNQNEKGFSSDLARFLKAIGYICALIVVLGIAFVVLGCFRISSYAFKTYESIDNIPYNKVGLLLGTSSRYASGAPNEYFNYRILAASQLYKASKIDYILVSGDNREKYYNEPKQMRQALIKAGVPAERIISDNAGISTLDSVIRARKVFLLKSVTMISQGFQNERALFIADNNELDAIGFNAINPNAEKFLPNKLDIREFFARIKCVFDIYFLNTQPAILGEPESIAKNSPPKNISNKPKKLTSAIKKLSDSAEIFRQQQLIRQYEPIAKQLTDNASITIPKQVSIEIEENKTYQEENPELSDQQTLILSQEQTNALEEASVVASDSVKSGTTTYIDDFEPVDDEEVIEKLTAPKPSSSIKTEKKKREDVKNFHGDPWDYE